MTEVTKPGRDEIALSAPAAGDLCHSLEHLRAGRAAQVRVTFGELGTLFADDLWPECWHHSYPMCGPCWQATRQAAGRRRPALVVRGTAGPWATAATGTAHERGARPGDTRQTHRADGAVRPVTGPRAARAAPDAPGRAGTTSATGATGDFVTGGGVYRVGTASARRALLAG